MPIYDYVCKVCKKSFEYFHTSTKDKEECPHCGSKEAEKQVSKNTGFQLKGPRWAKDGYGR